MNVRALLLTILPAVLAACSPANVGGPDAAGPSADKACGDSAYARCSRFQSCSPTALQLRYQDVPTCEANMKAACLAALAAPSTGQTASGIEQCVAQIPNWACADYVFSQNPPPECNEVSGSLANGAACGYAGQCQSAFCAIVPEAQCGVCAGAPAAGDSCAALTSCGTGLACDSTSSVCLPTAAHLASCAPSQKCAAGNECVGSSSTTGASGTCQTAVESAGSPCRSTAPCDFYAGLTCGSAGSCVPVEFATGGQPCGYVGSVGQDVTCSGEQRCIVGDGGPQGTCTTASGIGGACDLSVGPACIASTRCVATNGGTSGTCANPDANACH
ncbi:MAG TPA: hypothetical protein VIJ22_14720 [Polyangiaceae bacterium]